MLKPDMMLEATRLTRAGQLTEATALLQRMFRGETARDMSAGRASDAALSRLIIDEAIEETDPPLFGTATSPLPNRSGVQRVFRPRRARLQSKS
jgi:hypothetical protein